MNKAQPSQMKNTTAENNAPEGNVQEADSEEELWMSDTSEPEENKARSEAESDNDQKMNPYYQKIQTTQEPSIEAPQTSKYQN